MCGLDWEKHYSKALLEFGFQRILGWECLYFHPNLQVIFIVHVDGFKFACEEDSMAPAWQLMRHKGLRVDPSEPFKEYLGCGQRSISITPQ